MERGKRSPAIYGTWPSRAPALRTAPRESDSGQRRPSHRGGRAPLVSPSFRTLPPPRSPGGLRGHGCGRGLRVNIGHTTPTYPPSRPARRRDVRTPGAHPPPPMGRDRTCGPRTSVYRHAIRRTRGYPPTRSRSPVGECMADIGTPLPCGDPPHGTNDAAGPGSGRVGTQSEARRARARPPSLRFGPRRARPGPSRAAAARAPNIGFRARQTTIGRDRDRGPLRSVERRNARTPYASCRPMFSREPARANLPVLKGGAHGGATHNGRSDACEVRSGSGRFERCSRGGGKAAVRRSPSAGARASRA